METSILEFIGVEIIGVLSPVSICMFLVVLLVYALSLNPTSMQTAATLVYNETPSDTTTHKLEGALLNVAIFIALIVVATFILVLLYYYKFTNCLKNYMRFSVFIVLGSMGGSIFFAIIEHFSIPIDSITFFVLLFNFTIVGVLSVFSRGISIFVKQGYMVILGIIVATWFTKLPEWTTWVLLVALALYDLVAVLAPGGPLKILVELASSRNEELPALIYEARPVVSRNVDGSRGSLGLFVGMASASGSIELQPVLQNNEGHRPGISSENSGNSDNSTVEVGNRRAPETNNLGEIAETYPLVANSGQRDPQLNNGEAEIVGERSPIVDVPTLGQETEQQTTGIGGNESNVSATTTPGIKLGLGDFIFYSVLVGRAAMYDLMTVYACYLGIISGLGCTLVLLAVCHRALPALPISITLGVMFYFLTRLVMEPFTVGISTNLMMF